MKLQARIQGDFPINRANYKWVEIYYQLKMDGELMCGCPVQLICREWVFKVDLCML